MRPYVGKEDLKSIIELWCACRVANTIDQWPGIRDIECFLQKMDESDRYTDTCLWSNTQGHLDAFCMMMGNDLKVFIHPQNSFRDFAIPFIEWAIQCARKFRKQLNCPYQLRVRPRDIDEELIDLLDDFGFERVDWYTPRMTCSLDKPIPIPHLPEGFKIRPVDGEDELGAWAVLKLNAFGHENTPENREQIVETRIRDLRSDGYIPELDLVVSAPDGTLVSFCVGSVSHRENESTQSLEGWTDPVGTHCQYWRKGLARCVVLEALHRLKSRGIRQAILGTGSWNTPMKNLAESIGYRTIHNVLVFEKEI